MRIPTLITAFTLFTLLSACGGSDAGTDPAATGSSAPAENSPAPAAGEPENKGTSVEVNGDGLQVKGRHGAASQHRVWRVHPVRPGTLGRSARGRTRSFPPLTTTAQDRWKGRPCHA
jgi:hypothetical protein